MSAGYVKVAETSEVPVGTMKEVEDTQILIANVSGNYYAISNKYSHMGNALSQGVFDGNTITYKGHNAQFDVTTGKGYSSERGIFISKDKGCAVLRTKG